MASSRNSKSKSSGLRILWIPGRRKHNPKGHFESTNKNINYSTAPQKKNQLWSLGGNKTHKDLIEAEPDTSLLEGPSVSGLSPIAAACTITATAAVADAESKLIDTQIENKIPATDAPPTPNSSSSTALLVSIPNSPEPTTVTVTSTNDPSGIMPATKYSSPPITTTVAEIIKNNGFAIIDQNGLDDIDAFDLPRPPKNDLNWRDSIRLNTSGDTTSSITTTMSSTSPNSETKSNENSTTSSPTKKKLRSHLSNQADVNSIESVSDTDQIPKLDLDWIDDLVQEHNANEILRKSSKHKKKKPHTNVKELDQLDGVPSKTKATKTEPEKVVEDDDKLVKCLYFTLMCCECSIS